MANLPPPIGKDTAFGPTYSQIWVTPPPPNLLTADVSPPPLPRPSASDAHARWRRRRYVTSGQTALGGSPMEPRHAVTGSLKTAETGAARWPNKSARSAGLGLAPLLRWSAPPAGDSPPPPDTRDWSLVSGLVTQHSRARSLPPAAPTRCRPLNCLTQNRASRPRSTTVDQAHSKNVQLHKELLTTTA